MSGPTTELGSVTQPLAPGGVASWGMFVQADEHVPELLWPRSVRVYSVMRTDPQVSALLLGMTAPIRRYTWRVDPHGARAEVYRPLAEDLGLGILGDDSSRPRSPAPGRFSHDEHLRHALLALVFGHAFFEQVGVIDGGMWRLRKLAYRPADTISEINVERDGGLASIRQNISEVGQAAPPIPVDRLVAYVWDREGASWVGRSMLRPLYKPWLLKDRLLRIDAIKHERNGVGMPIIEAPEGASDAQIADLNALAQRYKAGESGGGALPHGARLTLKGTDGSVPDTLASIRYHDESMARALMMMFVQLGQTQTGSRALGDSFIDFFALAQEALAGWYADVMSAHVLRDWVEWNYGPDEPAPVLAYERTESPSLSVADLVALISAGAITVDAELDAELRQKYGLPESSARPAPAPPQLPGPAPETVPGGGGAGVAARSSGGRRLARVSAAAIDIAHMSLPARPLRRQPYEQEVRAAVDYAALEAEWTGALDQLVSEVSALQASQIDGLAGSITAANGDLARLASMSAEPVGEEAIASALARVAAQGAAGAAREAAVQGKVIPVPALDKVVGRLEKRASAVASMLARGMSDSAARKAMLLTGGALPPAEVASQVSEYLAGLSGAYARDMLGGAVTAAQNEGRRAVFAAAEPESIYASELLDGNTCENCVDIDGTEYASLDEAEADYAAGGYNDCLGGARCRGTLVAVYAEAAPS